MSHIVTCPFCKEKFNRDKVDFVQISARRYAHPKCYQESEKNKTQEEKDKENLEAYILKLFNEPYLNARIKKQIKDFQIEYNYTYSGMLKTLIYWYEIKGNSTEKANGGIGIIPYVYKDASEYYYSIYLAQIANRDKKIEEHQLKINTFNIESPRTFVKKPKLFNIDSVEDDK